MAVILEIGKGVTCRNLPDALKKKIEKDLCFDNPDYINAMKQGRFIPADMNSHIHLYYAEKSTYWIPRGYIFYLRKWLRLNKYKVKMIDRTLLLKPLNLKLLGTLRDYQKQAEKDILSYPVGVLEAATGSGKTVTAIGIIVSRQQPTLIIVHSKELLYQWRDAIKQFTGEDCGLIGDGKFKVEPLTVGIINTVKKNVPKLEKHFGQVVVDETHKIVATSYSETLQDFPAKYYLGLTATPFRRDGLGHAIFACIGPKRHKVNKEMLFKTKAVLKPNVFKVESNFSYMFTNDYSTMISCLAQDESRNELICNKVHMDLTQYNESILIVSDRIKHLKTMQEILVTKYKHKSLLLTGSTKKKERQQSVKAMKKGQCKVLFASLSLISEGFDLPDLTALFLTTPIKYRGKLIQCCGRILRPKKGKVPRIYDIRDSNVNVLRYSGFARDKIYISEWK